ncbi:sperm flagellar protein 1-like [Stegodyphus dumicola]|uniref:sperm flagellar protein 1-like n=1 Tax=Stegodyphus dumicola TaxID=202533 RepID=UPI0015A78F28|nr:sperm flagellar protein 1-like [Stegodyphus dumicola]
MLVNLYDWLDTIPFSRPKKNFARDFSDGILAAELIKYFFPSMVEMHNYPTTNSVEQKRINWATLNQKVLRKLDFPLSDVTISDLANAKRETTEYVLSTLRGKIDSYMKRKAEVFKKKKEATEHIPKSFFEDSLLGENTTKKLTSIQMEEFASQISANTEKAKSKELWTLCNADLEYVPRDLYEQKVQELLEREETIQILKARVQRLQNTLNLKNVTIQRQQQLLERLKPSEDRNDGRRIPQENHSKNKIK